MSDAQKRSVWELQDWLMKHGDDSNSSIPNVSPKGDGRWVSLYEVWGRGNRATAHRRNIIIAWKAGELRAYEIAYCDGEVKLCQFEHVVEVEKDRYFNNPALPEGVRESRLNSWKEAVNSD